MLVEFAIDAYCLGVSKIVQVQPDAPLPFHVAAASWVGAGFAYMGRSHSLWYCDYERTGQYGWYETAFQWNWDQKSSDGVFYQSPEELTDPGENSSGVLTPWYPADMILEPSVVDANEFAKRWVGWWADMIAGGNDGSWMISQRRGNHRPNAPYPIPFRAGELRALRTKFPGHYPHDPIDDRFHVLLDA